MTNIVIQPEVIKALADCVIDVITNKIDWSTIDWQAVAEKTCQRPQGEWIDYNNTFYKCPECGYLLEKCCPECQNKVILPNFGADMRKEADNDRRIE